MAEKSRAVFKDLLDSQELVNITLKTEDGGEQKVHIELFAANSPYFRRMLGSLSADETVLLPGLSKETMMDIIHYIYTGELRLKEDKIKPLVDAAEFLTLPDVIEICKKYQVDNLNVKNCIEKYRFCRQYQYNDLKEKVVAFVLANFEKVYKTNPDFCTLESDDLLPIMSSDILNVRDEETVYHALMKWVYADQTSRSHHLPNMLRCVRMGLLHYKFFEEQVWTNPMISSSEDCQGILYQTSQLFADLQQNGGDDGTPPLFDLHHPFLRPRVPSEIIFVMGGWSAGSATNVLETYDFKTQRWFLSLNSDTIHRAYHGMLWHQKWVYLIGGFDGNQCFNSVRRYDPVSHAWEERGCMNVQRCYVSVASLGEHMYAMGGYDGQRRNRSCEKFDSATNQWSFIANMNSVRSDASADSLDGKIYIAGGFNGTHVLESAEYYEPKTNEWTLITNMMSPRSGCKMVSFRNYLFVIGGFNGSNRLATVERYDRSTRMWTFISSMLGPRSNFATAVVNDYLYVIGGFNGLSTISTAEKFDSTANSWRAVTDLNLNRSALAACTVRDIPTAHEYTFLGSAALQEAVANA